MGKIQKSKGNMYEWIDEMWSPGKGCQHSCDYCYMKIKRWNYDPGKIFIPDTKFPKLGTGKTMFIGHTCDLFASEIPTEFIESVIQHCMAFTGNKYIFQSKNPMRFLKVSWNDLAQLYPLSNITLGTTIETNRQELIEKYSNAPAICDRSLAMKRLKAKGFTTFITVEPIMDFDIDLMSAYIILANPTWVNIGADSKGHNLPEPSWDKIQKLIANIQKAGIEIRNKSNLTRLQK